jgi:hypothetical protein
VPRRNHIHRKRRADQRCEGQQPLGLKSPSGVREATAGACQALAVMASFVVFGLGWAVLADGSETVSRPGAQPQLADSWAVRLAPDSLTRYREDPEERRMTLSVVSRHRVDRLEIRHAQIAKTNRHAQ